MAKKQLQEMDVAAGTKQSKTAVNANAKPAMPMDTSVAGSVEDLGGPTPMNYKADDDSAKLNDLCLSKSSISIFFSGCSLLQLTLSDIFRVSFS